MVWHSVMSCCSGVGLGVVWCGVVRCGEVWSGVVWCGGTRMCYTVWRRRFGVVRWSVVHGGGDVAQRQRTA